MASTLPPIIIRVIPHTAQRYETCGDWQLHTSAAAVAESIVGREALVISVSDTGNPDHAFLVAIHELVEWFLADRAGITPEQVDAFDKHWEKHPNEKYDEPGDDPRAVYHPEHRFASVIERMVADRIGVDWVEYEEALDRAMEARKAGERT